MQEEIGIIVGLSLVAFASGSLAHWAWMHDWKRPVWIAVAVIICAAGGFYLLAESRTGGYLPGLGEMLIALLLLVVILPGLLAGMLIAIFRQRRARRREEGAE